MIRANPWASPPCAMMVPSLFRFWMLPFKWMPRPEIFGAFS
ncbi:MAG: hypothetical protein VXY33_11195 [Verrucomicrobiota bacterium]|nr:hypothetical protein [Verrucomicrobiota bacterium]